MKTTTIPIEALALYLFAKDGVMCLESSGSSMTMVANDGSVLGFHEWRDDSGVIADGRLFFGAEDAGWLLSDCKGLGQLLFDGGNILFGSRMVSTARLGDYPDWRQALSTKKIRAPSRLVLSAKYLGLLGEYASEIGIDFLELSMEVTGQLDPVTFKTNVGTTIVIMPMRDT